MTVLTQPGPYTSSTLWDGLTAYWKLDEASGVALDSGPNALHLTDNNTVGSAAGQVGGARLFVAAQSESLSRASSAELHISTVPFAVACWCKLDTLAAFRYLVILGISVAALSLLEWRIYVDSSNRPTFTLTNGTVQGVAASGTALALATWAHVVAQYDGATVAISVNAGTPTTAAYTAGGWASAHPLLIGYNGSAQYWNGAMDEFKLWGRAITPAEIAEDYANGLAGRSL